MFRRIKKFFGNVSKKDEAVSAEMKQRENFKEIARRNRDIVKGYEFCATMNPNVPLKYLERHGEIVSSIPESDSSLSWAMGGWIPKLSSSMDFLSVGETMSSVIGPIPADGGDFLPYLKSMRRIVERDVTDSSDEISEAIRRVEEIKALPKWRNYGGKLSDPDIINYFEKVFDNEDYCLSFVLREMSDGVPASLLAPHIRHLHALGFGSIGQILDSSDAELLSVPGIGKARLAKIRAQSCRT